jgi:hypothetical protein
MMLWKELKPKMKGKANREFMEFAGLIKEPLHLISDTEKVFGLMEVLREALEMLDITSLPVKV